MANENNLMLPGLIKAHERLVGKLAMIEEIRGCLIDLDIPISADKKLRQKLDKLKEDKINKKAVIYDKIQVSRGKKRT